MRKSDTVCCSKYNNAAQVVVSFMSLSVEWLVLDSCLLYDSSGRRLNKFMLLCGPTHPSICSVGLQYGNYICSYTVKSVKCPHWLYTVRESTIITSWTYSN